MFTPQFTDYAVDKFSEEAENSANIEIDTVNYEFIAEIVDEEDMNALNMAIKARFIISSTMDSFLQSIAMNIYIAYCIEIRSPQNKYFNW